jgi:hypothetical protein
MKSFNKKHGLLCFVMLLMGNVIFAQTSHQYLRKGDSNYIEKDYTAAEENLKLFTTSEMLTLGSRNLIKV